MLAQRCAPMQVRPENETEEHCAPYIDDDPDGPILIGPACRAMPTALVHIFSDDGLVIAADGFNIVRTSDGPTVVCKYTQKIFQLSGIGREVACSFIGMVTLFSDKGNETIFDFTSECINAARAVASLPTRDATEFAAQICPLIHGRLS